MKRRIIITILALILALSIAGCGESPQEKAERELKESQQELDRLRKNYIDATNDVAAFQATRSAYESALGK